jgi:choice-of-anchor B domain-containing protein
MEEHTSMRIRIGTVIFALVALTATAIPALAHHDDDTSQYSGVMPQQEGDFSQTAAANADSDSDAPSSYAPCVNGLAAGMFSCDGVDLLSWVPHSALGTTFVNDMWGWTDPETGRDYALVGATEGTVFIDISDPLRPRVQGILPAHALDARRPFWRDIKVYADHAFVVSEQADHGMQVFDLTNLRDWSGEYTSYEASGHYAGIATAHNVAVNEDTGYVYVVGARNSDRSLSCGGGLHMVDVSNPTAPAFAGCFGDNGYVHDTQCVVYDGPDGRYEGHEICFNANALGFGASAPNFVDIVDVTDKENPISLGRMPYEESGYSHQGWLTPDQQFFLHGDEGDELSWGINTTTRVWDVRDLEKPTVIQTFKNATTSIDHNLYTKGRYAYASNYTSGLRVYDTTQAAAGGLREVAYFDVYPQNDNASFEGGAWSNYPYFAQEGVVAVSSIDRGLFLLRPRLARPGD